MKEIREQLFCLVRDIYLVFYKTCIILQVLIPFSLKLLTQFPLLPVYEKDRYGMSHLALRQGLNWANGVAWRQPLAHRQETVKKTLPGITNSNQSHSQHKYNIAQHWKFQSRFWTLATVCSRLRTIRCSFGNSHVLHTFRNTYSLSPWTQNTMFHPHLWSSLRWNTGLPASGESNRFTKIWWACISVVKECWYGLCLSVQLHIL